MVVKEATRKGNEVKNMPRVCSRRRLLLPLEMRSVKSVEDTHGSSATTTLVAPATNKVVVMHVPEAEGDFKAAEQWRLWQRRRSRK
jgi:hypothetical protein